LTGKYWSVLQNWDAPRIPQKLRKGKLPAMKPVIILDQIDKSKPFHGKKSP
jgi:hypothetical protein